MKIEIVQYEPIHAYTILDENIRERDLWLTRFPDWKKFAEGWKAGGPAWTMVIDGQIVGCAGVVLLEWGKGEAWTLLSSLFYQYKKTAFKATKEYLDKIIQEHNLRRVQAIASPEYPESSEFLKHLGFSYEAHLHSWGPNGEDYLMFYRLTGGH